MTAPTYLNVFDGVRIPIDLASTQTYALMARRDGGKTYTTLLFEEQLCDAGLYFVTLDPVGKHYALRVGEDGKRGGGKPDVWVLGGLHGDVPLEPTSGALIADTVVVHTGRYKLDTTLFESDAEQDRFALAFGMRLFRRKMRDPGFPLTLILEEAESFIPQNPQPGQAKMLGIYGKIMRQGRNFGLGMWMVAQRTQALNKGVLSQAEVLIAKQMSHNRDIAMIDEWVKANGSKEQRDEMIGALASLEQNEAYVWSPSWLRAFKRTTVPRRVTFDSSKSVKGGEAARAVELVPLDVEALGSAIAKTAERAKAEDPKELHKQLAELRRELAKRPTETKVETQTVTETVEVPVLGDDELGRLEEAVEALTAAAGKIVSATNEVGAALGKRKARPSPVAAPSPRPQVRQPAAPPREPRGDHEFQAPSPAQQRILNALAALEVIGVGQPSKIQLALFAQASPKSSGYTNNLGALRTAGLIDYPQPGAAALTADGRAIADHAHAPRTHDELLAYVYKLVGPARSRIIDALVDVYPEALPKGDLADRAGASASSSGYTNNLGSLRSLGLIDYPSPGYAAATPVLFLEAA